MATAHTDMVEGNGRIHGTHYNNVDPHVRLINNHGDTVDITVKLAREIIHGYTEYLKEEGGE